MTRRILIAALFSALARAESVSVRGKFSGAQTLVPDRGKPIELDGDGPTLGVLNDRRLAGEDFEAIGHFAGPGKFQVDPIHLRSMFVHKGAKRLMVTYWCDVCYIRTYTPGVCWCCQKYTDLDLIEPGA